MPFLKLSICNTFSLVKANSSFLLSMTIPNRRVIRSHRSLMSVAPYHNGQMLSSPSYPDRFKKTKTSTGSFVNPSPRSKA